jgi:hypothetical protein
MSRTKKLPRWWFYYSGSYGRYTTRPWQALMGKDDNRRYRYFRNLQQRQFRQATRMALAHGNEPPPLPPIDWWMIY